MISDEHDCLLLIQSVNESMTFNDSIIQSLYPLTSPRLISWSQPAWEPGFEAIWMWHVILGLGMFFCVVSGSHWGPVPCPDPEKSEIKRADMTTSPVHLLRCVPFQKPSIPHVHVGLYLFRETEKQGYFLHTQNDWNVRILIWPILAYPGMRI